MSRICRPFGVAFACALLTAVAAAQQGPRMRVAPEDALVDAPTTILVSGLAADQPVVMTVRTIDGRGRRFASRARFTADGNGVLDVSRCQASGSYKGIDPMGLFWSMEREGPAPDDRSDQRGFWLGTEPLHYQVEAAVDGKVVAQADFTRRRAGPDIREQPVGERGLVATVTLPAGEGRHPAILHFGGSEGGPPRDRERVALLASRGYVVLSIAYFNAAHLPATLSLIPVEYFRGALDWLENQPYVDAGRVGVMAASRGTEMAFLLASLFDDVHAVVAFSPSSVVWGGFDAASRQGTGTSPWSYGGRPVTYMTAMPGPCARRGMAGADLFRCALSEYHEAVVRASIPVEQAKAPFLLVAGQDDRIWPSDMMTRQIEDRRRRNGSGARDVALLLPHCGHILQAWPGPAGTDFQRTGGDRAGSAKGFETAWPAIVHFLHEHLGGAE